MLNVLTDYRNCSLYSQGKISFINLYWNQKPLYLFPEHVLEVCSKSYPSFTNFVYNQKTGILKICLKYYLGSL